MQIICLLVFPPISLCIISLQKKNFFGMKGNAEVVPMLTHLWAKNQSLYITDDLLKLDS